MLTITIVTIIDNNVMPVTGSMWAMRFSGIWKPGAMWFPMEVHNPGDHVPPADEAGGIVYAHCHADEIAERETQVSPHARSSGGATDLIAPHFLGLLKTVVGQLHELSFCKRIMRRSGPRVEITRRFPKFVKRSHLSFPYAAFPLLEFIPAR